jgi:hypothetical protein
MPHDSVGQVGEDPLETIPAGHMCPGSSEGEGVKASRRVGSPSPLLQALLPMSSLAWTFGLFLWPHDGLPGAQQLLACLDPSVSPPHPGTRPTVLRALALRSEPGPDVD